MIDSLQLILTIALIIVLIVDKRILSAKHRPRTQEIVLDSCGLIDARIVALAGTIYKNAHIIIPDFIFTELQLLADGNNTEKRNSARRGLEAAEELSKTTDSLTILKTKTLVTTTDSKLLEVCQRRKATLYTTDYNLQKLAQAHMVEVINIHDIATLLKKQSRAGDTVTIMLSQKGSGHNQAIGYTDDGDLVVVDHASKHIGQSVSVEIVKQRQTASGRMFFARLST